MDEDQPKPAGFLGALPSREARDCFLAWRKARGGATLPLLRDFAPQELPPAVLPWVLIHRLWPDAEPVYGLVGEEVVRWFGRNPKGEQVLADIDPAERTARLSIVRQSLATGLALWFTGTLLVADAENVPVGRLGLPARDGAEQVMLTIYFVLQRTRPRKARAQWPASLDPEQVIWCDAGDLTA
jgi:hypothetical protein